MNMAEQQRNNPLTDEHLTKLNRLIQECTATREYLRKCENCGLNVEPEQHKNNQQLDVATKLKAAFFPNEP
jgi:hypothetical protein